MFFYILLVIIGHVMNSCLKPANKIIRFVGFGDRLTRALKVLFLALPPHQCAPWTCGIHVPGQGAHVEGGEAIGRHGAWREGVAERCRKREG